MGGITHSWNGTILTITSDSGTSSADLKGEKGDDGARGAQGATGFTIGNDGLIDTSNFATKQYVDESLANIEINSDSITQAYVEQLINDSETNTERYIDNKVTQLSKEIVDVNKKIKTLISYIINVFDCSTITTGKFLRHDINTTPDAENWSVSDYIYVGNMAKFATGYIKHVLFYDSEKAFIAGSGFEVADGNANVITIPTGAKYVRFDWYVPKLEFYGFTEETIMVIPDGDSIPDYYIPYNVPYEPTFNGEMKELEYWKNKKILWLGTSIPEGNRRPAYGYPNILGERLGCTVINNAVGGSMAMSGRQMIVSETDVHGLIGQNWGWTKGFTQPLSLKEDFINNWDTWKTKFTNAPSTLDDTMKNMIRMSSYENALDPYLTDNNKCDLYVINFGWNESTPELYSKDTNNKLYCDWTYQYLADNASNIESLDPYRYNTKTFRGAINWIVRHILEAQPQATILIIGEGEAAAHVNLVTAQEKCAFENALQYIPLWKCMGQNQRIITTDKRVNANGEWVNESYTGTVQYCRIYDGTHPQGWITNKIADYLEAKFRYEIRC